MAQLATNSRRLETAYIDALARAVFMARGRSHVVSWSEALYDPTY